MEEVAYFLVQFVTYELSPTAGPVNLPTSRSLSWFGGNLKVIMAVSVFQGGLGCKEATCYIYNKITVWNHMFTVTRMQRSQMLYLHKKNYFEPNKEATCYIYKKRSVFFLKQRSQMLYLQQKKNWNQTKKPEVIYTGKKLFGTIYSRLLGCKAATCYICKKNTVWNYMFTVTAADIKFKENHTNISCIKTIPRHLFSAACHFSVTKLNLCGKKF